MMRAILTAVLLVFASVARAETFPLAIPFDLANSQIFLKVAIGDAQPMWFILDSGASACVIDTRTAHRLKLKTEGSAQGTGAGRGTVRFSFASNVTYRLAGTDLTIPRSYVIDLSGQKTLQGREVAGILGYDFFAHYTVVLDFDAQVMTLYAPNGLDPKNRGEIVPFTLEKKTPHIPVTIKVAGHDAVERTLLVDSGSGDSLDVDDLSGAPDHVEVVGGVGLGQEFHTVLGRAEWMRLGSFRLDAPFGAVGGVPLIGIGTLRRFDIVFDYARSRILLKPNRFFAEPFAMDASGLDLRWTDDLTSFAVHDVAQDSPATDAGLTAGDVIVAIGNQPASNFTIEQIQRLLTKGGNSVFLTVRRGNELRYVTLDLRKRL